MQTFKRPDTVLPSMTNCYQTELNLLQKHWDTLTNEQRSVVLDDLEDGKFIDSDILDELSMRFEIPCVPDFNRPNIGQCLDVIEKMTPTELQTLETHIGCTINDLKVRMNDGNVLYFLLQNYLVRNFTLNLPALQEPELSAMFSIPFKLRRNSRTHLRMCKSSTRHTP